jgi:hypothetical protein
VREADTYAKENGHPPVAEGVVLVDFDSTLREWGDLFEFKPPFPGASEFLHELVDAGYRTVLFTSRLSSVWHASEGRDPARGILEQVEFLREYCEKFDLPFDFVTAEKIPSVAIIDDKAVEFRGDWTKAKRRFKQLVK